MAFAPSRQYEIARPTGVCAATGEAINPGDVMVATLAERQEDDGFERRDYSAEAWEKGARPAGMIGHWRTVMPEPGTEPKPFIDDDSLLGLFHQLEDAEEPSRLAFRFVLALMLLRKRMLRPAGMEKREGQSIMLVRARGPEGWSADDPPIEVIDPGLDEQTLESVTEQLGQVIRGAA